MGYIKPDKFLLYADDSHHGGAWFTRLVIQGN